MDAGWRVELKEGIWNGSTHGSNLKLINGRGGFDLAARGPGPG